MSRPCHFLMVSFCSDQLYGCKFRALPLLVSHAFGHFRQLLCNKDNSCKTDCEWTSGPLVLRSSSINQFVWEKEQEEGEQKRGKIWAFLKTPTAGVIDFLIFFIFFFSFFLSSSHSSSYSCFRLQLQLKNGETMSECIIKLASKPSSDFALPSTG